MLNICKSNVVSRELGRKKRDSARQVACLAQKVRRVESKLKSKAICFKGQTKFQINITNNFFFLPSFLHGLSLDPIMYSLSLDLRGDTKDDIVVFGLHGLWMYLV